MLYDTNYKFVLATDYKGKKKSFKKGDTVELYDLLDPHEDVWEMERKSKTGKVFKALIIKHYKVQEIKRLLGLKPYSEPQLIVSPSIENGMTAVFQGAFRLPGDRKKPDMVIGEANKSNVQISYIVSMAHKRWFDRAVLDCIELYDAYSDTEAEAFEKDAPEQEIKLTDLEDSEIKVIQPFIDNINKSKDAGLLDTYAQGLKKQLDAAKVSENGRKVVQSIYLLKREQIAKF